MSNVISIIALIFILGLVIFIHEFGHFLLAKKNGVGVVEFAIGMGPNITSWTKNGTKYCLKWIPFGGYCMMLGDETIEAGQNDEGEVTVNDDEHAFRNKPVWSRIAVIAAGPIFNFILAFILALLIVGLEGVTIGKIGTIFDGYPAETAGLESGDVITKINGEDMHFFKEISLYVTLHEGENLDITYLRDGETHTTTLVPQYSEEDQRYYIGISQAPREKELNVGQVFQYSFYELGYNISLVYKSLGMLFTGKAGLDDLSGPVGMAGMVGDIVNEVQDDTKDEGFWTTAYWLFINLANFTLLISANLGVMNLLPIPGMDGGRLIFLFIEAVRGKPVEKKKEGIVTMIGFIFLIGLMVVVLFNDIRKVFF